MIANKAYWAQILPHPLSPNESDIKLYKDNLCKGSTLLLGCTHKLLPHTDCQLDIDPWYSSETVIQGDWRENHIFFDNIVGDGVLNLDLALAEDVIKMASTKCRKFIVRYFLKKHPSMQVAENFVDPSNYDFEPQIILASDDYAFLVWSFHEKW